MTVDELRKEAIELVPGLMIAGHDKNKIGYKTLVDAFMADAKASGVSTDVAISLLFNAAMHWARYGVATVALERGDSCARSVLEQFVAEMANKAAA